MKRLFGIVAIVSALWPSLCFAGNTAITQDEFEEDWPFKAPKGVLECIVVGRLGNGQVLGAITFTAKGKTYAVNGTARSHAKKHGWKDLKEIWRDNPKAPGTKVDVGVVISRGQLLCEAPS